MGLTLYYLESSSIRALLLAVPSPVPSLVQLLSTGIDDALLDTHTHMVCKSALRRALSVKSTVQHLSSR